MKARPSKLDPFTARLDEWFFLTQPALTLKAAREELRKDGCSVSLDALSRWHQRRARERENELVNDWTEQFEAECHKFNPNADADQVRQFVIHFLIKKAASTGNDKLALLAIDREQQEITGRTKARLKERELLLAEKKFQFDAAKAALAVLPELNAIKRDHSLSEDAKLEQARLKLFGVLPAEQKS